MKNWIRGFVALLLFSALALGQATPISSTPDQSSATAAPQKKAQVRRAKAHHAKAHHVSRKKHHKRA